MSKLNYRDACRRQHRVLGLYIAQQAWLRGLDCVVVVRQDLENFLELDRFKGTRVQWLREDLKTWFKYQWVGVANNNNNSIQVLFLSRKKLDPIFLARKDSMTLSERIECLRELVPFKIGVLTRSQTLNPVPSEKEIVSQLALLASGITEPIVQGNPQPA